MKKINYIVFDTETGGLKAGINPVLEFAAVSLNNNLEEIDRYETLIKPYDDLEITKEALKANGLNLQEVKEKGITKEEAVENIYYFVKKQRTSNLNTGLPIVVGHNVDFDNLMMHHLFLRNKFKVNWYQLINRICIDTIQDSWRTWPKESSFNLSICCQRAGIELINAHRGMPDVLATANLFRFFTNKLRNENILETKQNKNEGKIRTKFQF